MNIKIAGPVLIISVMAACNNAKETAMEVPVDLASSVLIPKPASVSAGGNQFEWKAGAAVQVPSGNAELERLGQALSEQLNRNTGIGSQVATASADTSKGSLIILSVDANDQEIGNEGYILEIGSQVIRLKANQAEGVFRGMQTLLQLFPDQREPGFKTGTVIQIPTGTIRDYPTYTFRGSMLDLGRHFFGVEDIKRYLDLIAYYKINVLHLHLSDDQGWRIEIKSWPKLAQYGGSTQVGGGNGGFLTQEQYKEIVKYAQDRYITVIPEIDMPGHTNAALASYPELNCSGKSPALYSGTEVGFSTLCVKKDITYKFIDDVVRELAEMTPGPYIHLGGDESHATPKDDYIYFENKIQSIPKKYGKRMIGWEEITQSNLDSSTVVQYWTNATYAQEGVKKGARIIMSPATKVYLDMKYDSTTRLGQDWAARIEVDSAYNWTVSTRVPGIPKESILGIEAPLWTETITKMDEIEYMVFPRLPGIAELGWSPETGRSWEEYKTRLAKHGARMEAMGIDFYRSALVPWSVAKDSAAVSSN